MSSNTSSPPPAAERIRWRRILDAADPARIRALVDACGNFSDEEVRTAAELASTTLAGTETYRFVLAETPAEGLLGYICFDRVPFSSVSFDLYWIAVAPERRGTGLAQELLARTASLARQKGGLQIYAETSSRDVYAQARAFYLKAGFAEAARLENFYAKGDDKLIFRLGL